MADTPIYAGGNAVRSARRRPPRRDGFRRAGRVAEVHLRLRVNLHPDMHALLDAGTAFRPIRSWSGAAAARRYRGRQKCRLIRVRLGRMGWIGLVGLARFELATP